MRRLSLIAIALLAFVAAPQLSFADIGCMGDKCDNRCLWVEIVGDGNCYVKF